VGGFTAKAGASSEHENDIQFITNRPYSVFKTSIKNALDYEAQGGLKK
jgi:hypothetical protein